MPQRHPSRRLSLESLETRTLLAGNITATVADGVLRITGDAADNRIYIRQLDAVFPYTPWPGARYEIADLYPQGRPVTTVNGQSSVIVEGVKNGITINLGAGSDFVNISRPGAARNAATVSGRLVIDMAGGNDAIRLFVVNHRDVVVRAGIGSDGIVATGQVSNLHIETDGLWSNAPASYSSVWLNNLTVKKSATVNAGAVDDLFLSDGLTLEGPLALNMGGGHDYARVFVNTANAAATVDVDTGDERDDVEFGYEYTPATRQKSEVRIDTGADDDSVHVRNILSTSHLHVSTGAGADQVLFRQVFVDSIFLSLGDDDDSLTLQEGISSNVSDVDGGAGSDLLRKQGLSINLGEATVSGFEVEEQGA